MNDTEKVVYDNIKGFNLNNKTKPEIVFFLSGILSNIVLTDLLYNKNIAFKQFTNDYLGREYKDYLFSSRTLLFSRIVRDAYEEEDLKKLRKETTKILNFITSNMNQNPDLESKLKSEIETHSSTNKTRRHSNSSALESWRKVINPNREEEN